VKYGGGSREPDGINWSAGADNSISKSNFGGGGSREPDGINWSAGANNSILNTLSSFVA